jgi:hypothetical protein
MRLSDFIRTHSEQIANEWEAFARTCSPAAAKMNVDQLRVRIPCDRERCFHGMVNTDSTAT